MDYVDHGDEPYNRPRGRRTPADMRKAKEVAAKLRETSCVKGPVMRSADTETLPGSRDTKETNPKDAIGSAKVPLAFVSPIAAAYWAAAQDLGLVKYGAWNWRICGARASVYISAAKRHLDAYLSGEKYDPTDGTHHLGNVMACSAILIEAEALDVLIDDRPPGDSKAMRDAYAVVEANMAKVRDRYKDLNPRSYTIADTSMMLNSSDTELPHEGEKKDGANNKTVIHGDPWADAMSEAVSERDSILEETALVCESSDYFDHAMDDPETKEIVAAFLRGLKGSS